MATAAYNAWVRAGKPFSLAKPLEQLRSVLQAWGYTVYAYPDTSHQLADPPEDHTPYSATGWPDTSPRWWGFAVDIMPKAGSMLDLASLAQQIIRDKDARVPGTEFIKYMNWTDAAGKTWQTSWKPNKVTRTSSDKGHIHLSGRSDMYAVPGTSYDPVARRLLPPAAERNDEDMAIIARDPITQQLYFCSAGFSHPIAVGNIADITYIASQGAFTLAKGPAAGDAEWEKGGVIRKGWSEPVFGQIYVKPVNAPATVVVPPEAVRDGIKEAIGGVKATVVFEGVA